MPRHIAFFYSIIISLQKENNVIYCNDNEMKGFTIRQMRG